MHIAVVGATGQSGSKIMAEALSRGHTATAIVRNAAKLPNDPKITPFTISDVTDVQALTKAFKGADAVIDAYNPSYEETVETRTARQRSATQAIIDAMKAAGIKRILAVGGAGTLMHKGVRWMENPLFPSEWMKGAVPTAAITALLKLDGTLDWTVLSPSHMYRPGERTGKFRLGLDELLFAADGESKISQEDFAMAMIDELENPQHIKKRFTVGY